MDEEFLSEMEAAKAMEAEAEQLAMEAEQATEKAPVRRSTLAISSVAVAAHR